VISQAEFSAACVRGGHDRVSVEISDSSGYTGLAEPAIL
jgi:hypothetical protein